MKMAIKISIIILIAAMPAIGFCVSSANFNIDPDDNIDTSKEKINSANYQMWGSVEPIVGESTQGNKTIFHGSVLEGIIVAPPAPPAPGGGTVHTTHLIPTDLNFDEIDPELKQLFLEFRKYGKIIDNVVHTYSFDYLLNGAKDTDSQGPWINESLEGVTSESPDRWQKPADLILGDNMYAAYIKNDYGQSATKNLIVHRRLIGDVNDNRIVDDYDLSLFTVQWQFELIAGWESDFNEDLIVDDYDISLMAAYWGESY